MAAAHMVDARAWASWRYAIKSKAQSALSGAIKRGEIARLDGSIACVDCGEPAKNYDHRDYTKPLEVEPVCVRCNFARGPGMPPPPPGALPHQHWASRDVAYYEVVRFRSRGEHRQLEELAHSEGCTPAEFMRQLFRREADKRRPFGTGKLYYVKWFEKCRRYALRRWRIRSGPARVGLMWLGTDRMDGARVVSGLNRENREARKAA